MTNFSGIPRNDVRWQHRSVRELRLEDLRAAVVGGTGGIGRAVARLLAERGAQVTVVGQTFRDAGLGRMTFVQADLSLMREARRAGRELAKVPLDLLVFTTGIMASRRRETTADGIERDMAVSYLSRLEIVRELAPALAGAGGGRGAKPRVFVMGFPGTMDRPLPIDDLNAEKSYAPMRVHLLTVAGNEALVLDGARRYPGLSFFGLNPGLIKTGIRANLLGKGSLKHRAVEWVIGALMPSAEEYAARIVPLLVSPDLEPHSGAMFNAKGNAIHASRALTPEYVADLIRSSEALLEGRARAVGAIPR